MENLKKVISLHEASRISGYNQDYLSSLIRKSEIFGEKMGGSWFTTEEEIKNYIFKQKIKNKNLAVRYLLSFFRDLSHRRMRVHREARHLPETQQGAAVGTGDEAEPLGGHGAPP